MTDSFSHLHVHTEYSLLDGAARIEDIVAAAVADGADCIDGVGQLCSDREHAFGAKASTTTMWRLVDERIERVAYRVSI